ncbi:hypothetical protein HAX54_014137, partial [Datura stramonium]|nr:hypothetical protein [Datura stramonium]
MENVTLNPLKFVGVDLEKHLPDFIGVRCKTYSGMVGVQHRSPCGVTGARHGPSFEGIGVRHGPLVEIIVDLNWLQNSRIEALSSSREADGASKFRFFRLDSKILFFQ